MMEKIRQHRSMSFQRKRVHLRLSLDVVVVHSVHIWRLHPPQPTVYYVYSFPAIRVRRPEIFIFLLD